MRVWEGKQGVGFLLQGGLLWSQLDQLQRQNKAKYYFFLIRYIGTQSDLTQVTTLTQKVNRSRKKWIVKIWQTVLRNSVCN